MSESIVEQLTREIAERAKIRPDEVEPDAHFVLDLGLSSLDMLSVLAFAEKSFAVSFPDEELMDLTTLEKLTAAVRVHQRNLAER